eukprot:g1557.t1
MLSSVRRCACERARQVCFASTCAGAAPLDGVRVIELEGLAAAPLCGMLLADFGADVVRVDKRDTDAHFATTTLGRGKRTVSLNLKNEDDRQSFLRLVGKADVLIEPYRPMVMERMGFGPDELLERNPALIYARMTGWGQFGAQAHTAGHDINYIAQSGALSLFRRADGGAPLPPVNLLGDFAGGSMNCALGILLALYERSKSGRGQVIDAAMIDGAVYLSTFVHKLVDMGMWNSDQPGTNLLDTGAHFYDCYECKCGGHMAVGSIEPQFYVLLLKGLGLDGDDSGGVFDPKRQLDPRTWPEARSRMRDVFLERTRDTWTDIFRSEDLADACVNPVLLMHEVGEDAHGRDRGLMQPVFGAAGQKCEPAPAPRLSRTPALGPRAAPQGSESDALIDALWRD